MKFIHAADLHIDSPLRGLADYEGAPVDRIRSATRDSFDNLVTLAIDERVDFVIIAGDLFDGKWPDISTGLWTIRQFQRLQRVDIDVYMIRGNHDAASEVLHRLRWPANVHDFSVDRPETKLIEPLNVAIHGQGFAQREVYSDLAAGYPDAVPGMFNIGVLHTSLTGDPHHDPYAPTTPDVLVLRGYDYWALGHVHQRRTVREEPFIAFPGNTQGRHIHEQGAKGCLVVSVDGKSDPVVAFRATDVMRWFAAQVEPGTGDSLDDLYAQVHAKLQEVHQVADGRFAAVRITVCGATTSHHRLVSRSGREEAIAEVRSIAGEFEDAIWIEKIRIATSAPIDLDQLRHGSQVMRGLLDNIDGLHSTDDDELRDLTAHFQPLLARASLELQQADIALDAPENLRRWLRQAEGILVSMLWEEDES